MNDAGVGRRYIKKVENYRTDYIMKIEVLKFYSRLK
jgi:hypothetical protein